MTTIIAAGGVFYERGTPVHVTRGWAAANLKGNTLNVQRFRGGLVFKAHRPLFHSTLGLRVMNKKRKEHLKPLPAENSQRKARVPGLTDLFVPVSLIDVCITQL